MSATNDDLSDTEGARPAASVSALAERAGVKCAPLPNPPAPGTSWTEAEEEVLRLLYPHHGAVGTHVQLSHRSLDAIRAHASKLGVHDMHRVWSPGEVECLKLVFPKGGAAVVHERLPSRSIEAIRHKAAELDLKHDRRSATTVAVDDIADALKRADGNVARAARYLACDAASLRRVATASDLVTEQEAKPHWKVTEVEVLRAEYLTGGATGVRKKLPHRSTHAIYRMAKRLGLTRRT